MGLGGRMYKYLTDVQFIKKLTHEGTKLTQALGHQLKIDYDIGTYIMLVGSAKRKMITQNEKGDVDMDYNLIVIKSPINNGKDLKEAVRKSFNKVLKKYGYEDCQDSTSSLSTKLKSFNQYNQTKYKFDIAIVKEDKQGDWQRLIHCKTGSVLYSPIHGFGTKPLAQETSKGKKLTLKIIQIGNWLEKSILHIKIII